MQQLADLLNSEKGRAFLCERGVFTDPTEFSTVLTPPIQSNLGDFLGKAGPNTKLVCSQQQVYIDYKFSVVAKLVEMRRLQVQPDLQVFFMWHDTDRAGSDELITKFKWTVGNKAHTIKIAPVDKVKLETRFVDLDATMIDKGLEKLKLYVSQSGLGDESAVDQRFEVLKEIFLTYSRAGLSEFNYRVTKFLLEKKLGWSPPSVMLSTLLASGTLNAEVELILNNLPGYIRVYNAAIEELTSRGIDAQVHSLSEDYLPLYFSCVLDNRRLRLRRVIKGADYFAHGICKCGQEYSFFLGNDSTRLSLTEVAETGRWSPDVSLPVIFNRHVSGLIMGKSSALYGLVMKRVMAEVLSQKPVPFLVPESLAGPVPFGPDYDSLIYNYLAGKEQPLA